MPDKLPTRLDALPRRFWTPTVAEIALSQGQNFLVLEMVDVLLTESTTQQEQVLRSLKEKAKGALEVERRRARIQSVINRLHACLDRTRSIRKERNQDTITSDLIMAANRD